VSLQATVCEPTPMKVIVSLVKLSSLFLLSGRLIFKQILEDNTPLYITLACRTPCANLICFPSICFLLSVFTLPFGFDQVTEAHPLYLYYISESGPPVLSTPIRQRHYCPRPRDYDYWISSCRRISTSFGSS
jgi:hypothetical protein